MKKNICKKWNIECNTADENGNCTFSRVTKSGLFIECELFCESEEFWAEHTAKQPPIDSKRKEELLKKLFPELKQNYNRRDNND